MDSAHPYCSIEIRRGEHGDIHSLLTAVAVESHYTEGGYAIAMTLPGWWTYQAWAEREQRQRLLYVGRTTRGVARVIDHTADAFQVRKSWPWIADRWLLLQWPDEHAMIAAEIQQIHELRPIYNIQHAVYKVEGQFVANCERCRQRAPGGRPPWWTEDDG